MTIEYKKGSLYRLPLKFKCGKRDLNPHGRRPHDP